ncbi:hypothetical protein M3Y96_00220600 [Aphelenchoides besseyi]|nr:hypothetical protein M3Y96_00220600 [Aphelenchoides besseyi]
MISSFTNEKNEPHLYQHKVDITTRNGHSASVQCVFQDLKPTVQPIGTVVAMHGAPGSHKDFKYISPLLIEQNIRFIGINFPDDQNLRDDNDERVQLVSSIVEALDLKENIIFVGHSRGSENALKMGALNSDKTKGVVLINPIGFLPHKGIEPYFLVCLMGWIWKYFPGAQYVLNPFLFWFYNRIGLRTPNGHCAGVCLHLMFHADFAGQKEFVSRLNDTNVRTLICYSGKDFLVQPKISRQFSSMFRDNREVVYSTAEEDSEIEEEIQKAVESGKKNVSVMFEKDGHFLQKTRAAFLAQMIHSMLVTKLKS